MSLSYLVAAMRCPACGTPSPATTATRMVNHLGTEPNAVFRVGDRPEVGIGDMEVAFLAVRPPDGPVHILQTWACPTCHSSNWAEVVFDKGTITSIDNVSLSRSSLERAHFIVDDIYQSYEDITGESLYVNDEVRPDFVERLRNHIPDS